MSKPSDLPGMQLPLFVEHFPVDHEALAACLKAPAIAVDVETETRWPGRGPRHDFGLSYPADVTVIGVVPQLSLRVV